MESIGLPDHLPLRFRPVLPVCERADAQPFRQRRQEPVFRLGIPSDRSVEQFQFRSAATCFALFASEPFAQGVDEVIVRQLEVLLPSLRTRHGVITGLFAFRVGRGDEPDFTVQNANQIVEVPGAIAVARGFQQLGIRSHGSFDVRRRYRAASRSERREPLSGDSDALVVKWTH